MGLEPIRTSPEPARPHDLKPWSLPLATDFPAASIRNWHQLLQRVPAQWERGIGGSKYSALEEGPAATLTSEANRAGQAIFQRIHHHDLLDTVLLHGQDRVEELIRAGSRILKIGAHPIDPKATDFSNGVPLADGSVAVLRPETLEPIAYSMRVLFLRTQLWMREFPHEGVRLSSGPANQREILAAADRGLSREHRRVFEAAIALAAQPEGIRERLLQSAPPHPCKPYAEAIDPDFERSYKQKEFDAWQLRKALEPGGERHRAAKIAEIGKVSLADKVFLHRMVRYRLDALRRGGPEGLAAQLQFGEEASTIQRSPLPEPTIFSGSPLRGLPIRGSFALLPERILSGLAHADHTGWLHASNFVEALGIKELRQPRGSERGDDAHQPYSMLPQSMQNRVRLNVLSRAMMLSTDQNRDLSRYLERRTLTV